ncbi:MAG: helix-turn-helix transcriptional regulator [Nitrospina sp.]|nr:helix-turn-helix transcriptional regulator [Nitrospina sp.]
MDIDDLAPLVLKKRGNMGVRATAKEIGVSPTTLTRVEKGNIPDVKTLDKICKWLGEEPTKFTGIMGLQIAFKNKSTMPPETAQSMAKLIEEAAKKFEKHIDTVGH